MVQHALGLDGMPRRVYTYSTVGNLSTLQPDLDPWIVDPRARCADDDRQLWRSVKHGTIAGPDPWKANTLEWFTTSPPPVNNFDAIPRVRSLEPMRDIRREVERRTGAQKRGGEQSPSEPVPDDRSR